MPIYIVKTPQGDKLVDAPTKAQAINHVIRSTISAEAVTATDVVKHMQAGLAVEKSGDEPVATDTQQPS